MRRGLTWLLVLPPIVVGSQLAHGIPYWWAYPVASLRITALASSGHGYLAYAPAALGFLGAVQALAFVVAVLDKARGRQVRKLPAWVFLFIPMLGFVLQEHIERFLTSGVFPSSSWQSVRRLPEWPLIVLLL